MKIKYDMYKLQNVLSDFHHVTGLKIAILDSEFHPIASVEDEQLCFCSLIQGYDNCQGCLQSDAILLKQCSKSKQIAIRECHVGLTNAAFPIVLNGEIIGYVILGQVRETHDFEKIKHRLPVTANYSELKENYKHLVYYTRSQLESAARTAAMLTISILAEDMIKLEAEELAEHAAEYIQKNLCNALSINILCTELKTSKNLLYKSFQAKFNCTINEYIINSRIINAKKLLRTTSLSVSEIGEKVGITDEAYFCRLFKRTAGCTPLQYRKSL